MAHASITPDDHGPYFEGDAFHIRVQIVDRSDIPIDITNGHAELVVKNEQTDEDVDAILEKSTEQAGEGEIVDPTDGEIKFYIDTGDTDGFLTEDNVRKEKDDFFVIVRYFDDGNNRVGVLQATWEITAS